MTQTPFGIIYPRGAALIELHCICMPCASRPAFEAYCSKVQGCNKTQGRGSGGGGHSPPAQGEQSGRGEASISTVKKLKKGKEKGKCSAAPRW